MCTYDFSNYLDEIDIYIDMQKYVQADPNSSSSNNYCYIYSTFCNCTPAKKVNVILDRYYKTPPTQTAPINEKLNYLPM